MSNQQLIDICLDLNSDKARIRMNGLESLEGLLNQEKVLRELNKSSLLKNEEVSWELLFIRVHKAIFTDIDRLDREKKKLMPKPKEIYQNVIPLLIEKAIHFDIPLIDCNTVISNVLSVFEVDNRRVLFGPIYLDVLKSYVLNKRECWGKIRSQSWIDMKNFCVEQYKMPTPGMVSNIVFLEILAEIIRISSKNSVIINLQFLDLFTFIKNIMNNKTELQNLQMALLRLTNILCRQMAIEYRFMVCEFMEDVMDNIINFYEPKTHRKNLHIYHFLVTALNVHCPNGSNEESNLSYAHDWKKWKRLIREIFTLCHREIKEILKDTSKTDVEKIFLDLLVDVTYLMFSFGFDQFESLNGVCDVDTIYSQSSSSNKRKRSYDLSSQCTPVSVKMTSAKVKQIKLDCSLGNILQELLTPNAWFWLLFLKSFFKKYPAVLKHEFQQVVDFLCQIYTNQADEKVVKGTCRCLCVLLKIEKGSDIKLGDLDKKSLSESWNKISETTLRSFRSHAYPEHYLLIISLIKSSKINNITPLIDLYRDELLESDVNNFNVLLAICQNCVLPDSAESEDVESNVRCQIIRWSTNDSFKYPSKDLSELLMLTLFKRSEEGKESRALSNNKDPPVETGNDFYQLVTRNYMLVSFKGLKFSKERKGKESWSGVKIDARLKNYLFECIKIRLETLLNELRDDGYEQADEHKNIGDSLHFCEVVAYLLSYFKDLNLQVEDEKEVTSKLERMLFLCSKKANELMEAGRIDLKPFADFYECQFHEELNATLRQRQCINANFLNGLFAAFRKTYSSPAVDREEMEDFSSVSILKSKFHNLLDKNQSLLSEDKFTEMEKLAVCAAEVLCRFAIVPGSFLSSTLQNDLISKMMQVLISDESKHFHSNFRLHLILRILYNLTKYNGIGIEVLDSATSLLGNMFRDKHYDFEIVGVILEISKGLVPLLHRFAQGKTREKFLTLINDFGAFVKKKCCGPRIVVKYVECLGELAKYDSEGSWAVNEYYERVFEDMVPFLRHPSNEVRLTAAQKIGILFSGSDNYSAPVLRWQEKMIEKLRETISGESDAGGKESCKYSKTVIFSSFLIAWGNVICCSAYWRKPALLNLLLFVSENKVSRGQTEDIFKVICDELGVPLPKDLVSKNFPYLVHEWIGKKYEIEDFPYYLLGCETAEEFLTDYLNVIVPFYLVNGQKNIVKAVCNKINVPLGACVEKCLPELMTYVLPRLNENITTENVQKARDLKFFVEELLRPKSLNESFKDNLEKMICVVMNNFHDPKHFKESCGDPSVNLEAGRNEFGYGKEEILHIFQDLSPVRERSLLGYIALKKPSAIQQILSSLSKEIWTGIVNEDRILSSHKYFAFLELLSDETKDDAGLRRLNSFLIRDTVYNLIYIIRKNYSESLTSMTCKFLKKFSGFYLEKFHAIYIEYLPVIISVVVPLVKKCHDDARDVLNFLIRDNFDKLQSVILLLDPLPAEDIFSETNSYWASNDNDSRSLKEEIGRFLNAGENRNSGCRLEGLKNLHRMLADRKEELREMYENLEGMRGFSEDCHESLLHRLVCMLVELASEQNSDVKTEAAKCLGELGPADLTTLVLKPKHDGVKSKEHAFKKLLRSSSILLHDLMIHEDRAVREKASECLYALLSTTEGTKIVEGEVFPRKISDCLAVFRSPKVASLNLKIDPEAFRANVDLPYLWIPNDHEKWIAGLVKAILKALTDSSGLIPAFSGLVDVHWPFAESIFPMLVDSLLNVKNNSPIYKKTISFYVDKFFQENFSTEKEASSTANQKSVQCLVDVIDYIRVQRNYEGIYKSDLDVNYLDVAKAAFYCSAYFTSILYAELWFEEKKREDPNLDIDRLCEKHAEDGAAVAKILRECYFKIGIPDGIHGCGYNHLLEAESEIKHYEHLKKWDLSMLHHDIRLSENPHLSEAGLLSSLHKSGMFYTSSALVRSDRKNKPRTGFEYECAARLGDWSLVDSGNDEACFEKWRYFALKAFCDDDLTSFQIKLDRARECVLSDLSSCSLECSKNVYEPLAMLRSLKESEDFARAARKGTPFHLESLYGNWCAHDTIKQPQFKLVESVLNQRILMVKAELEKNRTSDVRDYLNSILCDLYFKAIKISRRAKRYDLALRSLSYLYHLERVPEKIAAEMNVERARIAWEKGEKDVGKFFLFNYLKGKEIRGDSKAKGLRLYGDWVASTRSENALHIIENYYLPAINEAKEAENKVKTYASLAKFADYNYEQLHEYLSSPLFEMKQDLIAKQQDLASGLEGHPADEDKRRAAYLAKRQSVIDETEIRNAKREKEEFLNLALKFYLLVLKEGEIYDLLIFRVVSLWLSNSNDQDVTRKLKEMLPSIPSHKFLCVLPQILPRMAEIDIVATLIRRILSDHPYHTLPLVFALEKSYEDLTYTNKEQKQKPANPRVLLARKILAEFQRSDHKNLKNTITEMNRFCAALVELAHYSPPANVSRNRIGEPVEIPSGLKITGLTKMDLVPVPTLNLPYRKSGDYGDVVKIKSFEKTYENVGGVNAPKKIKCLGTDGLTRTLLIKGKDDLRQDAVMQQVFTIMNSLLSQNSESGKRKLVIRTYKVVPLSQRSGIIEWCENTQPIGLYLIGQDSLSGAHRKFNPGDITASECRMRLRSLAERKATNREKLTVYLDICKKFRPAFHNYFIENFPTAEVWFERRLAYTLSVAASSMIGYVLGIGDRHVCNILVDNATAEVIHIDLGIAFEQGKSLPTPEAVPFRLSRDVVDGMGLSGVEGVFRSACIKTMQVLRNNRDTILTLLEVLLYDPLYAWTITPEKAMSKQSDSTVSAGSSTPEKWSTDVEVNKMAERALIKLKQKLQGSEGGVPTNIEGQVNFLIQQARDPNNLSRMFHGWQAYL